VLVGDEVLIKLCDVSLLITLLLLLLLVPKVLLFKLFIEYGHGYLIISFLVLLFLVPLVDCLPELFLPELLLLLRPIPHLALVLGLVLFLLLEVPHELLLELPLLLLLPLLTLPLLLQLLLKRVLNQLLLLSAQSTLLPDLLLIKFTLVTRDLHPLIL